MQTQLILQMKTPFIDRLWYDIFLYSRLYQQCGINLKVLAALPGCNTCSIVFATHINANCWLNDRVKEKSHSLWILQVQLKNRMCFYTSDYLQCAINLKVLAALPGCNNCSILFATHCCTMLMLWYILRPKMLKITPLLPFSCIFSLVTELNILDFYSMVRKKWKYFFVWSLAPLCILVQLDCS